MKNGIRKERKKLLKRERYEKKRERKKEKKASEGFLKNKI